MAGDNVVRETQEPSPTLLLLRFLRGQWSPHHRKIEVFARNKCVSGNNQRAKLVCIPHNDADIFRRVTRRFEEVNVWREPVAFVLNQKFIVRVLNIEKDDI
jgi:hypothetical protein